MRAIASAMRPSRRQLVDPLPRNAARHGGDDDAALRAGGHLQREQRVLAAQHGEARVDARDHLEEVVHVGVACLHADDVLVARQLVQHLWRDRDARSVRNLVDQNRHRRRVGVAQEVVAHALLRRRRVVGRDDHQRGGAGVGESLAGGSASWKPGSSTPAMTGTLPARLLGAQRRHAHPFGARQRAVFAGAADRHDAGDAAWQQVAAAERATAPASTVSSARTGVGRAGKMPRSRAA